MLKPILEILQSVKLTQDGAKAKLTATLKGGASSAATMMPMMLLGARSTSHVEVNEAHEVADTVVE